ncbi:short-chain dehydrogenase [Actinoalloteichus sp. AHMU CJ021]|uniref:SDR family NAD(P)-dependent oxidoreductase n=2 Tax=Pseudonocardiaceae TaxID=2070 RepID=UPI000CA050F4|nr:short-chain dehydrogenase [Actinoalloteichus sp. AHMU CJ021]
MSDPTPVLTADTPVGQWLTHPVGGPLLRDLLSQGGVDEDALAAVRQIPLGHLVALSRGRLPQDAVDDLVTRAGGEPTPPPGPAGGTPHAASSRFDGRTVIVTGAASGIGRATAARVLAEGGRVVAVDIAGGGLETLAAEAASDRLHTVVADITDRTDVDRVVDAAGTRIDGLANVAGVLDDFSPAHEVTDDTWRRCFDVNVDGTLNLVRAVIPAMLRAGAGSIVNVASEAALRGSTAGVAYTASKHAVVGLTRSCAVMYGPHGIRVNAVAPGGVATGMAPPVNQSEFGAHRIHDLLRSMPPVALPARLAAPITFLLSEDGANVNGVVLPSDGGWSAQ